MRLKHVFGIYLWRMYVVTIAMICTLGSLILSAGWSVVHLIRTDMFWFDG